MTFEQLWALEEIRTVKARYCYHLDYKEWDAYADLFTRDATLDVDTAVSSRGRDPKPQPQVRGRDRIRTFITFLDSAETVNQVHSPILELISPQTASGVWAMEDVVRMPGFHLHGRGHYRESYRIEDGRWRIRSLHLTRTSVDMLEGNASSPNAGMGFSHKTSASRE